MSRIFVFACLAGLVCVACSSGTGGPSGEDGTDAGSTTSGGVRPAPPSGTDAGPPAPLPNRGCHVACKCYEPPYHPDEIDCRSACTKLAGWTSDSVCAYFAGTEGIADCERRCDGIRATWEQPNLATLLASEIFGCATLSSSCETTKSCVQAYTDQQKTVCP